MAPFLIPTRRPDLGIAEQAKKMRDRETNMVAGKLTDKQKRICDSRGRARGELRWNVNATVFTDGRGKAIELVRNAFVAKRIGLDVAEVLLKDVFNRPLRGNWKDLLEPRRKSRSVTERPKAPIAPVVQKPITVDAWLIVSGFDDDPEVWDQPTISEPTDELEDLAWAEAGWGSGMDVNFWGSEDDDRQWSSYGMHVVTARAGAAGLTS